VTRSGRGRRGREGLDVVARIGDDGQVGAELLLHPGGEFGPAGAAREQGDVHSFLAKQGAPVYCPPHAARRQEGARDRWCQRIGAAIAERLAAEGAEVWVGDIDVPGAERVAGEIKATRWSST